MVYYLYRLVFDILMRNVSKISILQIIMVSILTSRIFLTLTRHDAFDGNFYYSNSSTKQYPLNEYSLSREDNVYMFFKL